MARSPLDLLVRGYSSDAARSLGICHLPPRPNSVHTPRVPHHTAQGDMQESIARWKHAFNKDENSIQSTLLSLAWNYASYHSIVRAANLHPDVDGKKELNGLLFELLRSGYWAGTLLAIRKVTDRGPLRGPRGVVSLRSIARDVESEQRRFTRRAFVEDVAGAPYDYEEVERASWKYLAKHATGKAVWIPRELDPYPSIHRHAQFDYLSGVDASSRSETDLIRPEIFQRIEVRLSALDVIADHATIHFAHAATDESRVGRGLHSFATTDAMNALKQLAEIAELMGRWFANSGVGDVLAVPQFDQFAYLDRPILPTADSTEPRRLWDEIASQTAQWSQIADEDL